jgi:threonyl-tRNA synthetase
MAKNLRALRHSTEHVLTQAMTKLWPNIKMAMGPATEDGFYFDFELGKKISEEDFPKIEREMVKIIKKNLPYKKEELSIKEARNLFKNNSFKQEWLDEIESNKQKPTVYWTGEDFVDLCSGPHVKSTGEIKAFKLLSVAGAYWRGDEKNKMLTRI